MWCFCCFVGICPLELFLIRIVRGEIRRTAWLLKRRKKNHPDCLGECWKVSKISNGRRIKVSWEGRRRALCTQKLLGLRENKRSQCDGNKGTLVHSQPGGLQGWWRALVLRPGWGGSRLRLLPQPRTVEGPLCQLSKLRQVLRTP